MMLSTKNNNLMKLLTLLMCFTCLYAQDETISNTTAYISPDGYVHTYIYFIYNNFVCLLNSIHTYIHHHHHFIQSKKDISGSLTHSLSLSLYITDLKAMCYGFG